VLKNFTLLFVEDDPGIQEQMKILLGDEVKNFYQAFDGKEGWELYQKEKPDIVLSDINMPEMSGLDMAAKIKKIEKKIQSSYSPPLMRSRYF
jgi:YesN/AraC family two-component response regulator